MGSQGPLYRVRIGPMKNEGQAQLALRQAVDLGHPDARLVMANRGTLIRSQFNLVVTVDFAGSGF